eukprot:TRINITY_DN1544_c1_g1_i2.p1 TRINITY_DN1544_c1_g1~~TRINITY_DN1544_c1_g1_i2.p1  ORF type:complete len:353 (+),score=85.61 TRINITY_DN1544_c1_g1_i2:71-1129(+)
MMMDRNDDSSSRVPPLMIVVVPSSSSSSPTFSPASVTLLPSPRSPPRNVVSMVTYTLATVAIMAFILYYARNLFYFLEYVKSLGLFGNIIIIASYIPTGMPFAFMSYYIPLSLSSGFMYGYYLGIITTMFGSVLSAFLGFWITRRFCRSWVEQRMNESRRLGSIKATLEGHAFKITFIMRFLPLPFGLQNGLCAMTNITPSMFILASFIGLLPENILLIYFGYSFDSIGELARGNFGHVSIYQKILLVSAILGGIGLVVFGKRFITTTMDPTTTTTGYAEVPNRDVFLNVSLADIMLDDGRVGGDEGSLLGNAHLSSSSSSSSSSAHEVLHYDDVEKEMNDEDISSGLRSTK